MSRHTRSKYCKIAVCIWADDRFRRLSPLPPGGKAAWLYLITCPYAESIPGLIPMGRNALAEALNWPVEEFVKAIDELIREGMIEVDWDARLVWIPKAIDHNPPGNPNILKHWLAELEKIQESSLKQKAIKRLCAFCLSLGEAFAEAITRAFPKEVKKAFRKASGNTNSITNSGSVSKSNSNHHQHQGDAADELKDESSSSDCNPKCGDVISSELVEQCNLVGISTRKAKSLYSEHGSQKFSVAFQSLQFQKNSGHKIRSESGYVIGFLKDPSNYGYYLDQGKWVPEKLQVLQKRKVRQSNQPRSNRSVEDTKKLEAAAAWDHLDARHQKTIREQILVEHPKLSVIQRIELCRERAWSMKAQNQPLGPDRLGP